MLFLKSVLMAVSLLAPSPDERPAVPAVILEPEEDVAIVEPREPVEPVEPMESMEPVEPMEYADDAVEVASFDGDDSADERARERDEERRNREEEAKERAEEAKERAQEAKERAQEVEERKEEAYENAMEALDEGRYDRAIHAFDEAIRLKIKRADGALYWRAYALNKKGQRAEALAALAELKRQYPASPWLKDAGALEMEVKQAGGHPVAPEAVGDEELKLMALNGLLASDADRAVPMVEKLLQGNTSPRVRDRALFVLSQSGSPQAREVVVQIARGRTGTPDLQRKAVKYLGLFGGESSQQALADIYASSTDLEIKKAVLQSFMVSGAKDRVLTAARGEKDPELRRDAIRQLGVMGAEAEIWDLYRAETAVEVKETMLQAMFVAGNADRLGELARTEKDPELRRAALRHLGPMGGSKATSALIAIYTSDKDPSVRKEVLNGLFISGNARALVDIARKETDPELKREAVSKLSLMGSKEATDFLMEILNK